MKLILREDPKQWRRSALLTVLGLVILSSLLRWRGFLTVHAWEGILACLGVVALAACVRPHWFRGYYRFSARTGWWLNRILSRILLGLIFFLIVTPLGLLLRLFGKDLLHLKRPQDAATYWCEPRKDGSLDRLF